MKRKGDLIFWDLSDLEVTEKEMIDLGIGHLIPKNDYETVLLKAIAKEKRENQKVTVKNKVGDALQVAFFARDESSLSLDQEMIVTLNINSGSVTCNNNGPAWDRVRHNYTDGMDKLDVVQIRRMLLRMVEKECYGLKLRRGGAIYFIDRAFDTMRKPLDDFFKAFPRRCTLHSINLDSEDKGAAEAIAEAANYDIFKDLDGIVSDVSERLRKGEITKRYAEGRFEEAREVLVKIRVHRENLAGQIHAVETRQKAIEEKMGELVSQIEAGVIDPEDFMSELAAL